MVDKRATKRASSGGARWLRAARQAADGFSLAVSKTVSTNVAKLYGTATGDASRAQWFPRGNFQLSSMTQDKFLRGAWNKTARLEINFYPKGDGKSQLAVQISKLASETDVETQRKAWQPALLKLKTLVE